MKRQTLRLKSKVLVTNIKGEARLVDAARPSKSSPRLTKKKRSKKTKTKNKLKSKNKKHPMRVSISKAQKLKRSLEERKEFSFPEGGGKKKSSITSAEEVELIKRHYDRQEKAGSLSEKQAAWEYTTK